MNRLVFFILTVITWPNQAEVFKCQLPEGTVYQSTPCNQGAVDQKVLAIEKQTPEQQAEAQQRLQAWEKDFAAREAEERKAEQARQEQLLKQAEVDALQRNARAQEELAHRARQPIIVNQPIHRGYGYPYRQFVPVYPNGGDDHPHRHEHQHQETPAPRQPNNLSTVGIGH